MGSRGSQEPLVVLLAEVRRPPVRQVMTTPALTTAVASLATTVLALDMTAPMVRLAITALALDSIALVAPLVAVGMATPAVADTTTPAPLLGKSPDSCKAFCHSYITRSTNFI